jgi:DNA-binding transcriptional ArsR family regulator
MTSRGARPRSRRDDRLDAVFRALGDRTRRAIVARLARGPTPVTELAAPFAMSLPAISRHVKVLESAGLVVRTVEGRVHRCSLGANALGEAEHWIARYRFFWEDTLESLADYAEPKRDRGR